jgi:alpha-aminoadipate carrier protein LysW
MVMCPECESDLDLDEGDVEEGDVVECPECGSEFEVVSTGPLELTKIGDEDEDEDEDEYDEDEDEEEEEE